ncbi:uncharacterized protein [Taeniopygia guttata]|uniref:uncharacterized protein isoform X2 n=1 Tax=Taeniopygia guttata TaxID=59729 RepID=UPI003BB85E9D
MNADGLTLWQSAPCGQGVSVRRKSRWLGAVKAQCVRQSFCKMSLVRMSEARCCHCPRCVKEQRRAGVLQAACGVKSSFLVP